ncbi:F0F1 ATP synthase subunit epsilon [Macrococcus caseolyticus]|nr:F0F1 ATP synthase subunit epsilon [Macrococcus caseolyticus]RKO08909.1 F0F1 ATP synthase subunit epsilon [Macrococcus caseolyticus]
MRTLAFRSLRQTARLSLTRGYAEAAKATAVSADKIQLTLALPSETLFDKKEVSQVNLPTTSGTIGILASHVPTIEELVPGVVDVIDGSDTKSYFVAGGFASVSEGSLLKVNAIEAAPLDAFSASEVKSLLANAQKNATSSDEATATQAKIEVEVLEALAAVAK